MPFHRRKLLAGRADQKVHVMIVIDFLQSPPSVGLRLQRPTAGPALALDSKFIVAFRLITPRLE